ncbi:hypothetical protein ACLF3G_02985 [Falsiroseomonas sp. HC035]|uniref:hypothetical protein n=1 Tax=Falsiroseomonas sp. HC035 TaxID=3390999 RepID=UPI003D311438
MAHSSVELPEDQAARLQHLATFRATTAEALLAEVARSLVADADALESWLGEGEAQAVAGRTVPFEQVMADLDDIIARARTA